MYFDTLLSLRHTLVFLKDPKVDSSQQTKQTPYNLFFPTTSPPSPPPITGPRQHWLKAFLLSNSLSYPPPPELPISTPFSLITLIFYRPDSQLFVQSLTKSDPFLTMFIYIYDSAASQANPNRH